MKGVRILEGTRGVLSSKDQTGCGAHPPFSSVGTGCSFSASCCLILINTCFYLAQSARGSNLGWGRWFISSAVRLDRLWGPPSPVFNGYRVFFPGYKAPGMWHWPLTSNTEVRIGWRYTSIPLLCLQVIVRVSFIFFGAFAVFRRATITFAKPICLSFRPSVLVTQLDPPTGRIFVKFDRWVFL